VIWSICCDGLNTALCRKSHTHILLNVYKIMAVCTLMSKLQCEALNYRDIQVRLGYVRLGLVRLG